MLSELYETSLIMNNDIIFLLTLFFTNEIYLYLFKVLLLLILIHCDYDYQKWGIVG